MRVRDYAYEALAEVTGSDQEVARGQLNAALRDIRLQMPELDDSYLLSAEIHERAKMYRQVWPDVALTSTALSKHWLRLPEEFSKLKRGGSNLHADPDSSLPPMHKRNLEEVLRLREKMGWR